VMREKLLNRSESHRTAFEHRTDRSAAHKLNALPGNLLTLNGVNAVLGKRGTGKSTFALVQVIDAYLEFFQEYFISLLKYDEQGANSFSILSKHIIIIFNFRETLSTRRVQDILTERANRFVDAHLKSHLNGSQAEFVRSVEALLEFLCNQLYFIFPNTPYEFRTKLMELSALKDDPDAKWPFAVVLDDPGFIFNAIDNLTIRSDIRHIGRLCVHLVLHQNTVVVFVDSFKHFYEEKDDMQSSYLPAVLFASCSDCIVTSVVDNRYFKLTKAKSSKSLLTIR
jgi:hypothetical protein